MKKILFALTLFIAISIFLGNSAYAAQDEFKTDTSTYINLVGKDNFAVELQSYELIFKNEPLSEDYKEIWLNVMKGNDRVLRKVCKRGSADGATIDLSGLPDGKYSLIVDYVFYYEDQEVAENAGTADDVLVYSNDGSVYDYIDYEGPYEGEANVLYAVADHCDFYDLSIVVKGGKPKFNLSNIHVANTRIAAKERTDVYALDFYKNKGDFDYFKKTGILKQAKSIVTGITGDYEKVKAIQTWVYRNIDYDMDTFLGYESNPQDAYTVLKNKLGVCEGYSNLTVALMQAAGFPAKMVTGDANGGLVGIGPHAWTEVFIDNRWVFMDSTWGDNWFDMSVAQYSVDHFRDDLGAYDPDNDAWDGTLVFVDANNFNKVLKEVKNFPLNGVVNSTYGFNIKDLYLDSKATKPFKLGKMKVDSTNFVIPVDTCHSKFPTLVEYNVVDPDGYGIDYEGSFYKNFDYNYGEGDYYTDYYGYIQKEMPPYLAVPAGKLLKKPVNPVLKGYTFIGWYNSDTGKKWNFSTDKVKKDGVKLESRWKKVAKSYKVTFNSNKGTSLKSLIIATHSTVSKPKDPARSGYQFVGWYKDSKHTKKWNFTTDRVTANTTLYAKWVKTYTVTCNSNGGTGVFDVVVKAKTVATKPIKTVRTGYTFVGWYKDAECTTLWDFKNDKVTSNTTIYAGWKKD